MVNSDSSGDESDYNYREKRRSKKQRIRKKNQIL